VRMPMIGETGSWVMGIEALMKRVKKIYINVVRP